MKIKKNSSSESLETYSFIYNILIKNKNTFAVQFTHLIIINNGSRRFKSNAL